MSLKLVIDKGSKTDDNFEYFPLLRIRGSPVVSMDIGNKHFGVYVEDEGYNQCLYAAVWKLGEKMDVKTQRRLSSLLDKLKPFFQKGKHALVERQRAQNYMAVRLEQHTLTYIDLLYPHLKVISVPSDLKYRKMDGPLGDQKHKRKQWAVDKAIEELKNREDPLSKTLKDLEIIKKKQSERNLKGDDISDAFIQYLAWKKTQKV